MHLQWERLQWERLQRERLQRGDEPSDLNSLEEAKRRALKARSHFASHEPKYVEQVDGLLQLIDNLIVIARGAAGYVAEASQMGQMDETWGDQALRNREDLFRRGRVYAEYQRFLAAEYTRVTLNQPEPVLLGVSAPRAVKPNTAFIARFATYIKAVEGDVEKKLTALGGGKMDVHLGIPPDESARWSVGTPVTVRASGEGFMIQSPQSRFVWNGIENVVSFVIKTASTVAEHSAILCFEVYIEGIRVAFVPIQIGITAQPADGEQRVKATPARTAFASYASHDRDRVMDKLGALSAYDKVLKVFTDCLDMKPGESWKQHLEVVIHYSDLFLLFWSRAASSSQWVNWEWHTALEDKGLEAIQPMPLEAPQVAPPPPELSSLHFDDIFLIVRDAELARQSRK
jgi:hypothetical protein